jgi:hypothetical protein
MHSIDASIEGRFPAAAMDDKPHNTTCYTAEKRDKDQAKINLFQSHILAWYTSL